MQKFVITAKFLIIFLAIIIIIGCSWYKYELRPVSDNTNEVEVMINEGDNWYSLASRLRDNNLIRSQSFYRIYVKLFKPTKLEAGKYFLSEDMGIEKIIDTLEKGSTYNANDNAVTFKEGLNMRSIAKIISEHTNNSYESVFETMKDETYIDSLINNYWFLTNDIKNSNIYYPLEGYLFPETYVINKNSTVKDVFKMMLDQMNIELSKYRTEIEKSDKSIHELMTLSSIVELEAGSSNDRAAVAGVFYNRLNKGITLGSDVTAYYAYKMDDWTNGLSASQISGCNAYNTRGTCVTGLPVGPICNPGAVSIVATLKPDKTDKLFFVADCNGNTYLTKTNEEHEAKVAELKKQNKWCDR